MPIVWLSVWDTGGTDAFLAVGLCAAGIGDLISCDSADAALSQAARLMQRGSAYIWEQSVPAASRCRRRAYAGPTAGRVLVATPSKTPRKQLSNAQFSLDVSLRLGVDVFEGGLPCPFCGMAGGDAVLAHNCVRDLAATIMYL